MRHVGGRTGGRRLRVAGLLVVCALTAACNPFSNSSKPGPTVTTTSTHHTKTTIIVVKGFRTLRIGQAAQLGTAGQAAAELIKIGKPSVSRTRLSSYADDPEHGYFITFPIKIYNDGTAPLLVNRLDVWVKVPGQGVVNNNGGAAPFSGAPRQLDTTELEGGQGVSNVMTFDVSSTHGTFFYGPGGKHAELAWKY
jgi:hypothetical protein